MCFMVLLKLVKAMSENVFAKILKELGYEVDIRELWVGRLLRVEEA
ncbi:MAG: hypothetical protein QXF10_06920 [Ignisphaera sp.]